MGKRHRESQSLAGFNILWLALGVPRYQCVFVFASFA